MKQNNDFAITRTFEAVIFAKVLFFSYSPPLILLLFHLSHAYFIYYLS